MGRLMGLGELCEPMQTCNCSNPMKKKTPFVGVFLWGKQWYRVRKIIC